MSSRYPIEELDMSEDDGTMPANVAELSDAVIGHRIVSAGKEQVPGRYATERNPYMEERFVITLDNGRRVTMRDTNDCCAGTALESFLMHPESVEHMILGVGTTDGYTTWHIYADFGDVMQLKVGWSCGNPFYYGYGFDICVEDVPGSTGALEKQLAEAVAQAKDAEQRAAAATESHKRLCDMLFNLGREIELYLNTESPQRLAGT